MSETIQVKMAKASRDDIEKCVKFFHFIDEFMEYGTHTPENDEVEEESIELTDEKFVEMLRAMWGGRFKPAGVDCSWSRVVFGCDMLIQNVCDPDASSLEWKPDLAKLIDPPEGIEDVLDGLKGNREHFREMLTNKMELLHKFCDFIAVLARKKRVEPWTIMKEVTGNGSGVSSAFYQLYRRKSTVDAAS